jgi:hypothetical protein
VFDELHKLFNSGGGNVFDGYDKNKIRESLSSIKIKVDNTETLDMDDVCGVFLLRKMNL